MIWRDRPQKARAREYVFGSTSFVSQSSLWMPAADCLDIRLAFDRGLLDANSRIIAVERDRVVYGRMCATLDAIASEKGLIHAPRALNSALDRVALHAKVDFAFIDLCGALDVPILTWIETTLAPHLSPGADVAVTCTYAKRNSQLLQNCRDTLLSQWHQRYNEFALEHDYFDRHNDTRDFEPIIVPAILLKCACHAYDVMLRRPWPYADDMPMIAFKLSDIRRRSAAYPPYPSFTELHARLSAPDEPSEDVAQRRSAAARKAAATRRLKAESGHEAHI